MEEVTIGPRLIAARSGDRSGLAHIFPGTVERYILATRLAGSQVVSQLSSSDLFEAAIGAAALNACLPPMQCRMLNVFDLIEERALDARRVALVGGFGPLVKRLEARGITPLVFEVEPSDGQLPVSAEKEMLPRCDLVVVTGTSVVNHTLQDVLSWSGGHTFVVGPTTPLSPVLFEHGADAIAGVRVHDLDGARAMLEQGGGRRDLRPYADDVYIGPSR